MYETENQDMLLHTAIEAGQLGVALSLLLHGASARNRGRQEMPLHLACRDGLGPLAVGEAPLIATRHLMVSSLVAATAPGCPRHACMCHLPAEKHLSSNLIMYRDDVVLSVTPLSSHPSTCSSARVRRKPDGLLVHAQLHGPSLLIRHSFRLRQPAGARGAGRRGRVPCIAHSWVPCLCSWPEHRTLSTAPFQDPHLQRPCSWSALALTRTRVRRSMRRSEGHLSRVRTLGVLTAAHGRRTGATGCGRGAPSAPRAPACHDEASPLAALLLFPTLGLWHQPRLTHSGHSTISG